MSNTNTIILGGGLSGLSAAYYLGDQCMVLESEEIPGGLCRSFNQDGFIYDIGGHILFSKDKPLLGEITGWLGENVDRKRRNNQIRYKDRFVKYPFENGLSSLDVQDVYECLISFLNRPDLIPENLEEWCSARFGGGIAEKYLIPYNRKIWKRDLKELSLLWVDRIPDPSREDIIKSALGIPTEGYTHQLNFCYPKHGGIEALINSLLDRLENVQTGFRVKKITRKTAEWEISDGKRSIAGKRIISTIPIFDLIDSLENVPGEVLAALRKLQYNSVIIVMIGVNHEGLKGRTALYIPDPDILAHRVCYLKEFSSWNAPEGRSHLIAEITVPPGDPMLEWKDSELVDRVVADLKEICGFSKDDIIVSEVKRMEYAYVVYDLEYEKNTKIIYDYLDNLGIHYAGRFGSFKYINMDACVKMSKELVFSL